MTTIASGIQFSQYGDVDLPGELEALELADLEAWAQWSETVDRGTPGGWGEAVDLDALMARWFPRGGEEASDGR